MATGGVSDMERGTDETFDFLCSICKAKNKNTEGDRFCVDCHDYYCSTCVKFHDDVPVLKNHKILNQAQFQPTSSVKFPAVPTERCKVHTHKPVDMYCKQHDTVICSICMMAKHSACNEKFYVPEYIKNNMDTVNSNIADHLDTIANSLAELQDTFTKDKETLKSSKEKSLKQIQKYRKEINQMLDELEKKTINDLEQRIQSLTDKIDAALRELQATISDVLTAQVSLNSAGGNTAQMFVSIKMANEVASHAQEKENTTKSQYSSTVISFMPNQKLQSLLKDIQTLGDISQTEILQTKSTTSDTLPQVAQTHIRGESSESHSKATPLESLPQVTQTHTRDESSESHSKPTACNSLLKVAQTRTSNTPYGSQVTKTQKTDKFYDSPVTISKSRDKSSSSQSTPSSLQIKGKKRYTVKVKSDSQTCGIYSACTLADGTIILADWNNTKLKRVNTTSFTITDYCEVPYSPWQVCTITDQEVAVSCSASGLIQFVYIGRTMQKTRQINTGFRCYALAYADEKLFVSDSKSVYVYSVSGLCQQQICMDQFGQQIFSDIRSLAVSNDHFKIYVADYKQGVIILERNGQLVGQFNCPKLKGACGVYLHSNDSFLVCGSDYKNVLQFSLDGKQLGEVLKTGVACQTVHCTKDNSKLIVGCYGDDIEVYDISS